MKQVITTRRMKTLNRIEVGAKVLLASCLFSAGAWADVVTLSNYVKIGSNADAAVSGASSAGAIMTYRADTDDRGDGGISSALNGSSGVTFEKVGDKLTYNFTYTNLVVTPNTPSSAQSFRVGFDFGETAFLYHGTSVGSGALLEFYANTNGSPWTAGSKVGDTVTDWSPVELKEIRFATGNVIDGTVSLTLTADHGDGTYNYLYEVSYVSGSTLNSASQLFSNVTGAKVVSVNHWQNNKTFDRDGDTWTVTGASVTMIPEPTTVGLFVVASSGLLLMRRALMR